MKAKGFEFEATAAPARGLTIGGSLSYTKTTFTDVNPVLVTQAGGDYRRRCAHHGRVASGGNLKASPFLAMLR